MQENDGLICKNGLLITYNHIVLVGNLRLPKFNWSSTLSGVHNNRGRLLLKAPGIV